MKTNRQQFYILLLIIAISVSSVSSFSSRPRKSSRRGRRLASSSPLTTRRVFGFTLSGGAHKMFSTMRRPANPKEAGESSSLEGTIPSSTSLNYRISDECEENYQKDVLWQTTMSELREDVDMTAELERCQLLTAPCSFQEKVSELESVKKEKKPKTKDSELVETVKAFIPVVIQIGMVAAVARTP